MKTKGKMFIRLIVVLWCVVLMTTACNQGPGPVISTDLGEIQGTKLENAVAFKGVPFAKPPVGELRWKAPRDAEPWDGILDASKSQTECIQAEMTLTWHPTGDIVGSEDCLYLDIYRPKNHEEDLPVYVFFHGGGNRFGASAAADPSNLAKTQNIVVVVPQYRLGPLGWLYHPALHTGDSFDDSGNFGFLDNIKALEWIQAHIADFGGNPERVTVGGQSAGASNVHKMLISPLAAGLFQGAVLQSTGGPLISPEAGTALSQQALATFDGYDQIDPGDHDAVAAFMRSRSAEEWIRAHGITFAGFEDGTVLPGDYVESIFSDNYNHVSIMLGTTEYEFKGIIPHHAEAFGHPEWAYVFDLFDPDFDPDREWTFEDIFPTQADIDLYEALGKYQSAGWKYKAVDELATLLQQRQDGVYAYLFKWGGTESASAEFAHIFGSAHAMDLPFFLGMDQDLYEYALTCKNRPGFKDLQRVMMDYLGNFVRDGNPGMVKDVEWLEWSNENAEDAPACMIFNADEKHALIGMDTEKVTPESLKAAAMADVAEWDPISAGLVMSMLNTAPAGPAEYYLNDKGYDLLFSRLAFNALPGAKAYSGVNKGAGYHIEIPEGWTPEVGSLVMYAHGFRGDTTELTVNPPGRLRNYLINHGFAWAASSYTENGYGVASGVESTDALLEYFKATYGEPRRVYIVGHSMGGHITARIVTDPDYKDKYDGALPMCGVVGGGLELFSYFLDWGLLANYYAGLDFAVPFGEAEIADYQSMLFGQENDGMGVLGYIPPLGYFAYAGAMAQLNEGGQELMNATMYRSGGKRPLYDTAFSRWATFAIQDQASNWLTDPTADLGTNMVGNSSYVYQLDEDRETVSAEEEALNAGIFRVDDPVYPFDELKYTVTGEISIPVLTLHTIGDLFVPFFMEQLWAQRIADAGNADLFRARAIRSCDHCAFTVMEEITGFEDLVEWVESEQNYVPAGDDILNSEVVAADDFGCEFTKDVNPDYGDDPTRYMDDPDYETVCTD